LVWILESYNVAENELHLDVDLKACPRPQVTWMKNGQTCVAADQTVFGRFRSDLYSTTSESWHARLTIERPREMDSGVFTCVAKNYFVIKDRKVTNSDEVCKALAVQDEPASTTRKPGFIIDVIRRNIM